MGWAQLVLLILNVLDTLGVFDGLKQRLRDWLKELLNGAAMDLTEFPVRNQSEMQASVDILFATASKESGLLGKVFLHRARKLIDRRSDVVFAHYAGSKAGQPLTDVPPLNDYEKSMLLAL